MTPLSTVLSMAGPMDSEIAAMLKRAEKVAPEILTKQGALLGSPDDEVGEVLFNVEERMLTRDDRRESEAARDAIGTLRVTLEGQEGNGDDVALSAYLPVIDSAYYLGLAMGWRMAQTIGGAR
jgi:hypothetical protein